MCQSALTVLERDIRYLIASLPPVLPSSSVRTTRTFSPVDAMSAGTARLVDKHTFRNLCGVDPVK
jgi:hypothetical protein